MSHEPKPRFLAPITKPRDYVDRPELAVWGEPECVGPAILDGYSESARFHETVRHQAAVEAARLTRPLLDAEDRLKDAQRRAKDAHRDMSSEFRVLRHMLDKAQRGGRKAPANALQRLERVEAALDGVPMPSSSSPTMAVSPPCAPIGGGLVLGDVRPQEAA